jgi:hypothetical protein
MRLFLRQDERVRKWKQEGQPLPLDLLNSGRRLLGSEATSLAFFSQPERLGNPENFGNFSVAGQPLD